MEIINNEKRGSALLNTIITNLPYSYTNIKKVENALELNFRIINLYKMKMGAY